MQKLLQLLISSNITRFFCTFRVYVNVQVLLDFIGEVIWNKYEFLKTGCYIVIYHIYVCWRNSKGKAFPHPIKAEGGQEV
jgi:hypothetical protein